LLTPTLGQIQVRDIDDQSLDFMPSASNCLPKSGTTPKRVCMIAVTNYPFDGRIRLEAESLVEWGYEVSIFVPKAKATPRTYTLAGVTVNELDAVEYGGKNIFKYLFSYVKFTILAFVACTGLFAKSKVRIFHVHNMPNVLVFAALIPRLFGCTIILDVHDTVVETYQAKFGTKSRFLLGILRFEEWISCSMAQKIICVNHVQRESVIKRGIAAEKIATVITMPKFNSQPRATQRRNQSETFRMVNHGTISKRLGNDLIIEAAAQLVREIPGFELHIIGAGDGWDECKRLSESLGLAERVHFHNGVPWDELAKKLELMDVGIVANRVNAATELMLPSKLIDYVVLGIPAIVPRLKTIQYYFTPGMVSYFEPENVESMVATTVSVYKDKEGREEQSRNAKSFLEKYGWHNPQNGLRGLYDGLFWKNDPKPDPAK
jgi:glycosyltransferase involved in cell wall biosynthesis